MKNCILWTFALWLGGTAAGPLKAEAAARAGDRTWDVVVLKDVMVPMRDGVKLATDLYVPAENGRPAEARFPAVLLRTPYNKAAWGTELVRFFAQHGYLSATQDCRGRFASEGTFFPFLDDPKDGHDTIVWLAEHPLCNGKVGMHGPSYMAWTQFHAATQHPPGLVTMVPFTARPTPITTVCAAAGAALGLVAVDSQRGGHEPGGCPGPGCRAGRQRDAGERKLSGVGGPHPLATRPDTVGPHTAIRRRRDAALFREPRLHRLLASAGLGYGRAFCLLPRHARAVGVELV